MSWRGDNNHPPAKDQEPLRVSGGWGHISLGLPEFRQQGCPEESWGTGLCFEGDPLISRGLGLQGGHL